ncbi:MAG: hypothetical protein F4Y71_03360 [Acidobacteria bacterium]|nr:hypothetical protein [Acidobacteriota bacterium]MXW72031.1 hypothetical protein [Acidobacteriota bacterium]MXX85474.1 hypothetical protein [Acidobacteriota bacterium]MYE42900.1 hypothetical protein [Acidobacteriota bacterium]MYF76545.1 hypothetical protein [Acidobacteriota bacterium]
MKHSRTGALTREIAAYEGMRTKLEADHRMRWAVVHAEELVGIYGTFESAAHDAMQRFGRGPYLIRQIGAPPIRLPASVLYQPVRADG